MSRRWTTAALAAVLLLAVWAAARWSARVQVGVVLEPTDVSLRVGEEHEVWLVSHERDVVAFAFRLRLDEGVVQLVDAGPAQQDVLARGQAIVVPARRSPGLLEVPGVAVTGGRMLKAPAPLYRLRVRGVHPGTAVLAIEGFTLVDIADTRREVPATGVRISVHAP